MIPLELFKKSKEEKLSANEAKWIEEYIAKYPYFSLLHFINAKVAHHDNKDNAKDLASVASIYSNDRKKIANYIQQSLKTVFKPSSEILLDIPNSSKTLLTKETVKEEYVPKGPRVGMVDWKIQTIIQIRVQMFMHLTKLLLQELETYKKPKPPKDNSINPLSLNLAENILNLLNINLMELASNPNIGPSGIHTSENVQSIEKEQNIKGDSKTDFFAEKLAKLREANEELKKLKKITSESMKRFVEPNFDKKTYITEVSDDELNAKLSEQKQKALLENQVQPKITSTEKVEKSFDVTNDKKHEVIHQVTTEETHQKTSDNQKNIETVKSSEPIKKNMVQNITSDSMKRFKPLTFEEEIVQNQSSNEISSLSTQQKITENISQTPSKATQKDEDKNIVNSTDVSLEVENKIEKNTQNLNISSESFKRFVSLEMDIDIHNKKTETPKEKNVPIEKNISTDSFKRFVTPEFDQKNESLNSKNLVETPPIVPEAKIQTSQQINQNLEQKSSNEKGKSKELSGKQDSLKRFIEPEFDNFIKTSSKKEDTSLSRFVKPDFDENSKKSFKTEETVIEVQSTKYVIELIVKKDKIHHYFKKDVVSKLIEVESEVVQETVQNEVVQETVQNEVVQETVQNEVVQETVQNEVVQETVQNEVVQETVQNEVVQETVQSEVVQETVQNEVVQETIQSKVVQETVQNEVVQETVQNEVVQETVQSEVVQETVQNEVVQETVQSEVVQETVQSEVVQETVQNEVVQETVQNEVVQETVQNEVVQETVQNEVVQETVQNEVVQETVQNEVVQETVQNEVVQETVQNEVVQETVQNEVVQETVQNEVVQETVQNEVVQETVQNEVVHETVQNEVVQETVQNEVVQETVQNEVVQETVQNEVVHETVQNEVGTSDKTEEKVTKTEIQKPYHELINIEKLENRIAGHKKKAEIIGKKAQVSSDITLKSLQNKFLQSILKSKSEKKEEDKVILNETVQKVSNNIDDIIEKIKQLEYKFSSMNSNETKNDTFQIIENETEETHDLSEEIITETMAKIFLIQGDILKSIKIYKKLMEKNPQKRAYYEQKIKEIESK